MSGLHKELGAAFAHPGVARAYQYRPPYPDELFDLLERLVVGQPRTVLDVGAGEGALARPLARRVDRVDAVDISAAMIEAGRSRPGGDEPNLRWINDAIETAALDGPYALVTAGASLHWMQWELTLARLAGVLRPGAFLAVVGSDYVDPPWDPEVTAIISRHSRNPDFSTAGAGVEQELVTRGLYGVAGATTTAPVTFRQPVADYVEHFHSTSSLAREWMPAAEAASFDRAVTDAVLPYAVDGMLEMLVVGHLTWGRPTV